MPGSSAEVFQVVDQPSLPSESTPTWSPLTAKDTWVTPVLSDADAVTVTDPVTESPSAGVVMATVGFWSNPGVASTARRALTSGSAMPSGSPPHRPCPVQVASAPASAHVPFGHSPD